MIYAFDGVEPTLGRDVFIAPNATVIGDVHLGDASSVWFGCVVRGDVFPIRLGARTNLQDGSVVHVTGGKSKTTIGDDVTIGHMALLHGCTIGNRVMIGMGSVVLDDAVIEDEVILAAGSLVAPRSRIPARTLAMGRPAKVVRALAEEDLAWVRTAGHVYVESAKAFRSQRFTLVG